MKLALLIVFALSGCGTIVGQTISHLPSMEMCGDVIYIRHGTNVTVQGICESPGAHGTMEAPAVAPLPKAPALQGV